MWILFVFPTTCVPPAATLPLLSPWLSLCRPSDSGEVMRALCEGPEGEPRWAADVRFGDSVRIVRKATQAPQPPGE